MNSSDAKFGVNPRYSLGMKSDSGPMSSSDTGSMNSSGWKSRTGSVISSGTKSDTSPNTPEVKYDSDPVDSAEPNSDSDHRDSIEGNPDLDSIHSDKTDDSDLSDSTEEKSEIEKMREQSLLLRKQMTDELFNIPEFQAIVAAQRMREVKKSAVKRKRYSVSNEPMERRRSARVQNSNPIYTPMDDPEEKMYKAKRPRSSARRNSSFSRSDRVIIPIEEITPAHIRNIAWNCAGKKHCSSSGTSCHQCRQKTLDQKTCCRNVECIGVRGQFCGVCLRNRYGEDAAEALQDPNWHCPVCRGICNCSFCRIKDGNAPTGILTHTALKKGFTSVKDYLEAKTGKRTKDLDFVDEANCAGSNTEDSYPPDDISDTEDRTESPALSGEENDTASNTVDPYVCDEAIDTRNVTKNSDISVPIYENSDIPNEANEAGNSTEESSLHGEMNEVNDAEGEIENPDLPDDNDSISTVSNNDIDVPGYMIWGAEFNERNEASVIDASDLSDDGEPGRRLIGFNGNYAVYR